MAEFTFEIEEHLLTLSENDKGWTKELNRVSFNGAPAKFDIRAWSPDHTKMGKGITLSNEEFQVMVDAFRGTIKRILSRTQDSFFRTQYSHREKS